MKIRSIAGLVSLAFTIPAHSAENIQLENVVVTAARISQSEANTIGDITVVEREEIERNGANALTDVLRMQPGIQISTNGGPGTASSIYLRGTNDQHVVVLIDGLRVNSATLGTTSFESIPLSQIERIEILRGPASSLYGADAIGGVIQIFTRKMEAGESHIHAALGLGSYNTKTAEAGISGNTGRLKYGVNISSLDTGGFSAKRIRTGIDADNDGYRNLGASAYLELALAEGHSWGLQFFETRGRSEFDSNYDNYNDQTLQSYAFTSKNQFTDFWHSTFKLGMGVDKSDSYARPNTNPLSTSFNPTGVSKFRTDQLQLTWQNDLTLPVGTLTLAYDRLEQDVSSQSNMNTKYNRERNDDSFLASYLADINNHSLQLSLRENHNTQFGSFTTGGAGYGYRFSPAWRMTASYGKAFKAPSFNQLYFPNFGDPDLEPEKSDNIESSIQYSGQTWRAGVTVFENKIRNLIASAGPATVGCTFGGFCPINIGKVTIQGATADAEWNVTDQLLIGGNFTFQSPREEGSDNLVPRRGNRYGNLILQHKAGDLKWGAEIVGSSNRYNDIANSKNIGGYTLVNLTANYQLTPEWKLEARANNILDKNYVLAYTGNTLTAAPYNTAGSNLFLGLRYDMKN
jgi:vitamin B12 transporter